jgi:predicted DCC family thiol-disulfide oxidoreductase YuxK
MPPARLWTATDQGSAQRKNNNPAKGIGDMATQSQTTDAGQDAWLIYDGDCPFCSRYVQYVRVRKALNLRLVNAREGGPWVEEIRRAGLDLDGGMVLKLGDRFYHGADCIHALALLATPSNVFNRLNAAIFRSERLSRLLYPVLRTGRNTVLWLLGRRKLGFAATDRP